MLETYTTSFIGLWLVLTTITLQAVIATGAHRRQSKMVPGIVDPALSHESFVFRSDRTFRNSLENIAPFFGLSVLAMLAGFSPDRLAIIVWVYALARLLHMILYYRIRTEKNPSPRSYFYMIALLATFYLIGDLGQFLIM
ncbi:MAG: MAPEG family protein [Parvibaculales bacterium]